MLRTTVSAQQNGPPSAFSDLRPTTGSAATLRVGLPRSVSQALAGRVIPATDDLRLRDAGDKPLWPHAQFTAGIRFNRQMTGRRQGIDEPSC